MALMVVFMVHLYQNKMVFLVIQNVVIEVTVADEAVVDNEIKL